MGRTGRVEMILGPVLDELGLTPADSIAIWKHRWWTLTGRLDASVVDDVDFLVANREAADAGGAENRTGTLAGIDAVTRARAFRATMAAQEFLRDEAPDTYRRDVVRCVERSASHRPGAAGGSRTWRGKTYSLDQIRRRLRE